MAFSSVNINLAYARAMPPLYGRHFEQSGLPAIFVDMDYCGNSKAFSQAIEFQQVCVGGIAGVCPCCFVCVDACHCEIGVQRAIPASTMYLGPVGSSGSHGMLR